ncbi:MAG: hypothetical protein WD270_04355 [Acetobacterales bacterium]
MFDALMDADFGSARAPRTGAPGAAAARTGGKSGGGDESGSLGFLDLLDVVNPLQHIPGVSTLYREITGDEIKAPARVLGGAIYLGPIGFIASAFNAALEAVSGRDIGETVLAVFRPEEGNAKPEVRVAASGGTDSPAGAAGAVSAPSPSLALAASAPAPVSAGTRQPALFLAAARGVEPAPDAPVPQAQPPAPQAEPQVPPQGTLFDRLARQGRVLPPSTEMVATRSTTPPAEARPGPGDSAPADGFYGKMMDGLRKYQQLHEQRQAEDQAATGLRLDSSL